MGLLDCLNLAPPRHLLRAAPSSQAAAASKDHGQANRDVQKQLAQLIPRIKALIDAGDQRAAQAQKQAKEIGDVLKKSGPGQAHARLKALQTLVDGAVVVPEAAPGTDDESAARQSIAEFVASLQRAVAWLKRTEDVANQVLGKEPERSRRMNELMSGLAAVIEQLGKVLAVAKAVLKVAAFVDEVHQCIAVLERVQAADLSRDPDEAAKALGELARRFAELGGKLGGEVPGLNAYLTIVGNAGAVWEAGARLRKKNDEMFQRTGETDPAPPAAPPRRDPKKKDLAEVVTFADLPAFLGNNEQKLFDADGSPKLRDDAKHIRWSGAGFDEQHAALTAALAAHAGASMLEQLQDAIPGARTKTFFELQVLWKDCRRIVDRLEAEIGSDPATSVTYRPAQAALNTVKPKGL